MRPDNSSLNSYSATSTLKNSIEDGLDHRRLGRRFSRGHSGSFSSDTLDDADVSERRCTTSKRRPTSSFFWATTTSSLLAEEEGLLHMRGRWNPAWKKRYFVLTPLGNLEYYDKAEPDGVRLGMIPVAVRAGCCCRTRVQDGGRDGHLEVIWLTVRNMESPVCNRTYVLGAMTMAEHSQWMMALKRVAGSD